MTREEAIEILWRYNVDFEPHPPEEVMHAIDMAIEALADRPTESDFISKAKVLETYSELYWFDSDCGVVSKEEVDKIYERLQSLPSAEPKTGKWVRLEREENVYDLHGVPTWGVNYMCDKCGFITTAIQDHFGQYKWCPSCGADMRGGEDE